MNSVELAADESGLLHSIVLAEHLFSDITNHL